MIGLKNKKKMKEKVEEETYSAGGILFKKELPDLDSVMPQAKIIKSTDKNNFMTFNAIYTPESESYWSGGKYEFSFTIPDAYPFNPPKVMCFTKIYHPNIDFNGNVCLNILKEDWKPTLSIATVIAGVYFLFTDPNPNDPLNHEAAQTMRDNINTFISNIKKTLKGGWHFNQEFKKFT